MPATVSDALPREITERIVRVVRGFDRERVIPFGSQARGDARPDSDIDLLVVMPVARDVYETVPRDLAIHELLPSPPISPDAADEGVGAP